jgi:siroheme synthase
MSDDEEMTWSQLAAAPSTLLLVFAVQKTALLVNWLMEFGFAGAPCYVSTLAARF